jgi:ligand-binding SRPBCC domain-containing protein
LSDLVSRVRLELGDQSKQFNLALTGDGSTQTFDLAIKPLEPSSIVVYVGSTPLLQPTGFTVEQDVGVLHFTSAPAANSVIKVSGTVHRYFTDADITGFINTAVTQHTHNRTDGFGSTVTLSSIPAVEEYPLAILATIEALWALATDASFDININAPDGVNIPRSDRYRQLTQTIQNRWEQYKQLCSALNIGLWRIEMGTLRRISRTTNKLVPIYMAQEIDDGRMPERVYIQNDMMGRNPLPEYAGVYDIQIYQGDSWSQQFTFPFDVSSLDFKAQIRTYPNAPSLYASFDITIIDGPTGLIQLNLDPSMTAYLPTRAFWDLQATDASNPNFEQTYIKGQVFVQQQVTLD